MVKHEIPHKKIWLWAGISTLVLVLVMGLASLWLYTGSTTSAKLAFFRMTGLPVGKIGGEYVAATDVARYQKLASQLNTNPLSALTDSLQLAAVARNKIQVTKEDMSRTVPELANDARYVSAVATVGEDDTRDTLVRTYLVDAKLRAWYASQPELEPALAQRVSAIQQKLNNGVPLTSIAREYSDDTATKYFMGDAGYVDLDNAVFEYADAMNNVPLNTPTVVYTRHGIHIAQVTGEVQEAGRRLVRIQEAVLVPQGYDAWLAKQKAAVPVVWYINN